MALKLRRKRKLGLVAALLAVMALAACDTQPATDVTSDAATLNSKGACANGAYGGTNQYQLRKVDSGGGVGAFYDVGPRFRFDCRGATGEVPLNAHRVGGLSAGAAYDFRLVSRMDNGQVHTWDSVGTNGGNNFDWFYTPVGINEEATQTEGTPAYDPETGAPIASAASNCGAPKEVKRVAKARSRLGIHLWTTELRASYRYCNGQITRMYPASAECWTTSVGAAAGWKCKNPNGYKIRAYSTGGNPEHAVYTYSWQIARYLPIKGAGVEVENWRWCSTLQITGSGAKPFTHGSCDIKPWPNQ